MVDRNYSPVECRLGGVLLIAGGVRCVVVAFLPGYTDSRPFVKQPQVGFVQGACHTDSRPSVRQSQVGLAQGAGNPCHTDSRSFGKQAQVGFVQGP